MSTTIPTGVLSEGQQQVLGLLPPIEGHYIPGMHADSVVTEEGVILHCTGNSGDVRLEYDYARLLAEAMELFIRKQASYGPKNISAFGARGVVVRMNDKMQRLIRLIWENKDNPLDNESIKDTLIDMAAYAHICILVLEDKWPG